MQPKFFPHKPYFPFITQGHSKLTPVNSQHSKTLPNMLQNKKKSIISYKTVDDKNNSNFIIGKYPKCYNKCTSQNKIENCDE